MHSSTHSLEPHSAKPVWRIRVVTLVAAAIVSAIALYSADMPPLPVTFDGTYRSSNSAAPSAVHESGVAVPEPSALENPEEPRGTDASASEVPLRLVLSSTSPGRNPREGFAALGVDPASPQTYVAGALLANGARLLEIYPDRVVLERDGQKAELTLSTASSMTKADETGLLVVGGPQDAVHVAAGSSEAITDYVRPSPVFEGTQFTGLKVIPGANAQVFSQLGLKSGDVITAIDGIPLRDRRQAMAALREVGAGSAVMVSVQRSGVVHQQMLDGSVMAEERAGKMD